MNSLTSIQNDYPKTKIKDSKARLNDKVLETGYSPAGKRFIEICEQFTSQTNELIERISNNEMINSSDIKELISLTNYKYDTIKLDTAFINKAFKDYSANPTSEFATSLLLFNH